MAAQRRRHHKIDTFPAEVVAEVNALLAAGLTYSDVAERLRTLGHQIGESSVRRYGAQFLARLERIREHQLMVEHILEGNGKATKAMEAANVRLLVEQLFALLTGWDELDETPDIGVLCRLSDAIAKLQGANTQRARWDDELQRRAEAAAAKVDRVVKKAGLSKDAAASIRKQILGLGGERG